MSNSPCESQEDFTEQQTARLGMKTQDKLSKRASVKEYQCRQIQGRSDSARE